MIKYNVMCGKRNFGPDWMHFDGAVFPHVISDDIALKYQPNDYADLIYCAHGISYFSKPELKELLKSWHKKLKPGGMLRLATPDFDVLTKLYQEGLPLFKVLGPIHGLMQMNGQQIAHKVSWDEISLNNLLIDMGFVNVERYDHRLTEHPNTGDIDDFWDDHSCAYINGILISLNLQCKKP